jgi:hypothetical protein
MIKRNTIMSHSYSYIYPTIQITTLTDCSKSRAYDNNNSVSDYMMKAFDYSFKGLFAE